MKSKTLLESIALSGLKQTVVNRALEDLNLHGTDTVEIDSAALINLCSSVTENDLAGCSWCRKSIPTGPEPMSLGESLVYFTLLNSVNYCFWVFPGENKWCISLGDHNWDGALGLFAAVTVAHDRLGSKGLAEMAASLDESGFNQMFPGNGLLRLIPTRISMLRETGQVLSSVERPEFILFGDPPWQTDDFISRLLVLIPSYADPYLKRAQLLIAMLHGHMAAQGETLFENLGALTLFSDYKVPQIIEKIGGIRFSPKLRNSLASHEPIPKGSGYESAIRAATILSGEGLMKALSKRFPGKADATRVDFMLWLKAQSTEMGYELPYHRTETTDY